MRGRDMLSLPVAALWQQKSRTLLTTLGVVFGSFVLAASLSIGQGVQDTIERTRGRSDTLRRITVHPQWGPDPAEAASDNVQVAGEMSEAKRKRIQKALAEYQARLRANRARVALTPDMLEKLREISHVESVVPYVWQGGFAVLDGESQATEVTAARPEDTDARQRLVAGRFFDTPMDRAAVVSEFLLYRLGVTDDADVSHVVGKKIRLELRAQNQEAGFGLYLMKPQGGEVTREESAAVEKVRMQLPQVLDKLALNEEEIAVLARALTSGAPPVENFIREEWPIVGVTRLPTPEEEEKRNSYDPLRADGDFLLPYRTAADLFFRTPTQREQGVNQAVVIADNEANVAEVLRQIKALGLRGYAALEYVEQQRLMYLLIFGGMTCVAAVAMLVAALGIANTMLMSVLERTREIGIMKAVGAGNGQLQFIFLVEGALIGLVGGGLGMLAAWAASFPGDAWVRSMVSRDLKIELDEPIFVFPLWVILSVFAFAGVVTTLAAVYPARRAARVDPVAALRHE